MSYARGAVRSCVGYRIVFATWDTVTRRPERLLNELAVTLEA